MGGKTSIEHVLLAHYRAITDINWHTTEPDTVVSTGIDSWIWAWDLRTPRKPIFGVFFSPYLSVQHAYITSRAVRIQWYVSILSMLLESLLLILVQREVPKSNATGAIPIS